MVYKHGKAEQNTRSESVDHDHRPPTCPQTAGPHHGSCGVDDGLATQLMDKHRALERTKMKTSYTHTGRIHMDTIQQAFLFRRQRVDGTYEDLSNSTARPPDLSSQHRGWGVGTSYTGSYLSTSCVWPKGQYR